MAAMPARAAMPIPTPMPIEAPVERPELDFEVVEVWPPDDGAVEGAEVPEDVDDVDPAGGTDVDDVEPDALTVELGEDEDDGELELEASTLNSETGRLRVWPSVALGLLLQAALIVCRTADNRD